MKVANLLSKFGHAAQSALLAGTVGLEPTTYRLTADCSTY